MCGKINAVVKNHDILKYVAVCITEEYFAYGECCEADSTSKLVEPRLSQLRKYDARCCIIFTEGYRSGHNEAVLKTVWVHAHVGSNPTPSAKTKGHLWGVLFVLVARMVRTQLARQAWVRI